LELLINLFVGRCFFEMLGLLFVSDGVSVQLHNINMTSKGFLGYDMFMDYEESFLHGWST